MVDSEYNSEDSLCCLLFISLLVTISELDNNGTRDAKSWFFPVSATTAFSENCLLKDGLRWDESANNSTSEVGWDSIDESTGNDFGIMFWVLWLNGSGNMASGISHPCSPKNKTEFNSNKSWENMVTCHLLQPNMHLIRSKELGWATQPNAEPTKAMLCTKNNERSLVQNWGDVTYVYP